MNKTVTCPMCRRSMKRINGGHIKSHNLTHPQFIQLYPDVMLEHPDTRAKYGSQSNETRNKIKAVKAEQKQHRIDQYLVNPKLCKHCNTVIPYSKQTRTDFCNQSCRAKTTNISRVLSEQAKFNVSSKAKENKERLMHYTKLRVDRFIPYSKVFFNVCVGCNKTFASPTSTKQTCSNVCRSLWCSEHNYRQNKTRGKCGYFNNIWCASSWELAFVAYHIHLGTTIKRFESSIIYIHNSEQKRYFPDFEINDELYEVKGWYDETVDFKLQAAKDAGYTIHILTRIEIMPIIAQVKAWYGIKNILDLYD